MRIVVDRMAKLSSVIGFSANAEGSLRFQIATDTVTVENVWQNCPLPPIAAEGM